METNDTLIQSPSGIRSTFLTVLCVLTFIGSGWGIFGGLWSYTTADTNAAMTNEIFSNAKENMENNSNSNLANRWFDSMAAGLSATNIRKSAIIKVFAAFFTLAGAILMWNLKRIGFYIYVTGILIGIALPLVIIRGGMLGGLSALGTAFFGIIFVVMYGVNLKYMTK